jgi:chromosome segregation ATPase
MHARIAPDLRARGSARRMREDDGILAEAMVTEGNHDQGGKNDPVLAQFIELREYIEHSHKTLSDKFDGLSGKFDGLSGKFDGFSGRLDGLSGKFDGLETRMDKLETRVEKVEARVEKVEARLETVETRLGAVETRLGAVESRLGKVETGQLRLEQKFDAGFSQLGRKIDALASARRATPRRRKP